LRIGRDLKDSPKKISDVPPTYPETLRRRNVHGTAFMDCVIDERGQVVKTTALRGDRRLTKLASESVRQWRYEPTLRDGIPISVVMTVSVTFSLGHRSEKDYVAALKDDNPFVRHHAAQYLAEFPTEKSAVKRLRDALKDDFSFVRAAAARALAEYGERAEPAIDALTRALEDESPEVRVAAQEALSKLKR
jgi:TonB family protein